MNELGIVYGLTHPDGTRIAFGNSDAAKADPDYVGWLNPAEGVTGLDSAEYREVGADLVGTDGGINYDGFHGRRPITASGVIDPDFSAAQIAELADKILHVTNATDGDAPALLRWTNTGKPTRRLAVNRHQPTRIGGQRPKTWLLSQICADWRKLSDLENSIAAQAINDGEVLTNAGNAVATPRWEITGPATAPSLQIAGHTTINTDLDFVVPAGQLFVVDLAPPYPTVLLAGADAYDRIRYTATVWGGIPKGAQTLAVFGGAGGGSWRVLWRNAWV